MVVLESEKSLWFMPIQFYVLLFSVFERAGIQNRIYILRLSAERF